MASKLLPPTSRIYTLSQSPLVLRVDTLCSRQVSQRASKQQLWQALRTSQSSFHSSTCVVRSRSDPNCASRRSASISARFPLRSFTTVPSRHAQSTVEQVKSRNFSGPFSWKAALLFILTGAGMIVYFRYEKARLERKRIVEMSKGVGKPKVGGPFELKDLKGNLFTEKDLLGKYNIIYFGFTHCPDICPDELDKMASAIDIVRKNCGPVLRPIFITCDPARDTPDVLRRYLDEFHPKLIGLTGTYEQTKHVCKMYRVYFSTPENVKPGEDYLVDHSIYFYVMDPDGDFVECIGRQDTPESAARIIMDHIGDWKGKLDKTEEQ